MNYLEIILAAVAAFLLGFVWYSFAFGKAWQAETGVTQEQAQSGMAVTHGLAFVMMCIIAFAIKFVVDMHTPEEQTLVHGAFHGALACALFALPIVAINYLYQKKSLKLFLIDGGYALAFFAVEGAVIGALNW